MTGANKAQLTLNGMITDSAGIRAAQITIQSPGYLAYREGQGRAVTFDGTDFKTKSGQPGANDHRILESLLAHFPDTVCLQVATGGSWRRIGSHFRTDDGKSKTYNGPYWTLFAFSPAARNGLVRGKALQQEIFIAVDDQTGLISEIRVVVATSPGQHSVTQTKFNNWTQQSDQWFPAQIVRLENGSQVLSFQIQQAAVAPAGPVASLFQP